jgi:hypothetical protein
MTSLRDIRAGKPPFYPDQSIYAEYACRQFGLDFAEVDGGTGLIFTVGRNGRSASFGAGRGSFFPQNNATAATLANDKYFANVLMERAGVPTLGGKYFFLHERYRAHRPPGHEYADAVWHFAELGDRAFIKPLMGSRGDFAEIVAGGDALIAYLRQVAQYYDAILMQRIYTGQEYRIFILDDDVVYCAQKTAPFVTGNGKATLRQLIAAETSALDRHGISSAATGLDEISLDRVLPYGERRAIPGRMNRSAGGSMSFAAPGNETVAFAMALQAAKALGLRAGAVDLFTDIDGDAAALRVIEVNANPSIRFLEDSGREDLILRIWRHTFTAIGLLDV